MIEPALRLRQRLIVTSLLALIVITIVIGMEWAMLPCPTTD